MTEYFIAESVTELTVADGQPLRNTSFGIIADVDGRRIELVFDWNAKHRFYSMNVITPLGSILKTYPRPFEFMPIRGFNPTRAAKRDAQIALLRRDGLNEDATPETLARGYRIVIVTGRYEVLH